MRKTLDILQCIARILLGCVFLFSGFVKLIDPLGTAYKIADYLVAFGMTWAAEALWFCVGASLVLSLTEALMGASLVLRLKPQFMLWCSAIFMLVMTPLTLYIALANPVSDCGCFGDAVVMSNWTTFLKNLVLAALVVFLLCVRKGIYPLFAPMVEWGVMAFCSLAFVALAGHNLYHLPIMDFRPFAIGADIREGMAIPEDAERDVYETTFVYAKDGIEQEFTLLDYPKNDTTWTFVRQNTHLVSKGYEPPITDFLIYNDEIGDVTDLILEYEGHVVLAVMYDISRTDMKQALKLNAYYEQVQANGALFYALTASPRSDVNAFVQATGAQYEFCTADPIMLKTMIRANPGIVVLKEGVVVDKWNVRTLN